MIFGDSTSALSFLVFRFVWAFGKMCYALNQSLFTSAAVPFPLCFKANLCPFDFQNWSNCVERNCLSYLCTLGLWYPFKILNERLRLNVTQKLKCLSATVSFCLYHTNREISNMLPLWEKTFYFRWKLVCVRKHTLVVRLFQFCDAVNFLQIFSDQNRRILLRYS